MLNSREKTAWSYRTLREAPPVQESNVDITLFANYYGTVEKTHKFDDPALYTDSSWFMRLVNEIKAMRLFRRNKKNA